MSEEKHKPTVLIIVAIIGASATCIAAIIGLGQPLANRLVDIYLPTDEIKSTLAITPIPPTDISLSSTAVPVPPTATVASPTDKPVSTLSISVPPTNTPLLPTKTPVPISPTSTPIPPTAVSETITWRHNPDLPAVQGYPGAISYSKSDYPGNSDSDWVYGIDLSVNQEQLLLIAGYAGKLQDIGEIGGPTHCFLLITRGPFNSKIDLLSAGLEVHEVTSVADPLIWAAQKSNDLRAAHLACSQGIDIWIGR